MRSPLTRVFNDFCALREYSNREDQYFFFPEDSPPKGVFLILTIFYTMHCLGEEDSISDTPESVFETKRIINFLGSYIQQ